MVRILDEIRSAAGRRHKLREAALRRVHALRLDGAQRFFDLQVDTLQNVEKLLDDAPELPVVSRVTGAAGRLVHKGLTAVRTPPIPGYDELNVKQVNEHLDELGYLDLLKVRRYEQAHKARKTVIDGIDRELARRGRDLAA